MVVSVSKIYVSSIDIYRMLLIVFESLHPRLYSTYQTQLPRNSQIIQTS